MRITFTNNALLSATKQNDSDRPQSDVKYHRLSTEHHIYKESNCLANINHVSISPLGDHVSLPKCISAAYYNLVPVSIINRNNSVYLDRRVIVAEFPDLVLTYFYFCISWHFFGDVTKFLDYFYNDKLLLD